LSRGSGGAGASQRTGRVGRQDRPAADSFDSRQGPATAGSVHPAKPSVGPRNPDVSRSRLQLRQRELSSAGPPALSNQGSPSANESPERHSGKADSANVHDARGG